MNKIVLDKTQVSDKILAGLDFIVKPVVSTLSPKGHNVLIEQEDGSHVLTNDGVTIAKNLTSGDQIEDIVVQIVKEASLKTNSEAGDGTTTTVLLSDVLIREGRKLLDEGYSWIDVRNELNKFAEAVMKEVEKSKIVVKNDKGLLEIATTSANNDPEVAKNVVDAIKVAREDGMIFIDASQKTETEVIKDLGFMVKAGVMYQELLQGGGKNSIAFKDTPVLITDKKLYYAEEAETILRTAVKAGYKTVVVVARDFMGEAVNTFIANHAKGTVGVMLVKNERVTDKDNTPLHDLAVYLGGKVITDKTGSIVNKLTEKDFVLVSQVFSDPLKTLFVPKQSASKELKARVKMLQDELEAEPNNLELKNRIAALTTGIVTIKVSGRTPIELREKVFRYEDAINATRAAMRHGYLPGGGTALLRAYRGLQGHPDAYTPLFRKFCEAIVRQIAVNCGKHPETVLQTIKDSKHTVGYNANTDKYEDMLKAGIVDPFYVIKMAVENSISVANAIISINHFVINDLTHEEETES